MWIITVYDSLNEETIDVMVYDFEEVQDVLSYIKNSKGRLDLEHIEKRFMYCGLDGLRDATGNGIPDKI